MAKIREDAPEQISAYIAGMDPFAKEMCEMLRSIIINAFPGIQEDWKWGPNFNYKGMVCGFAAFQKHVTLAFFNGALMSDTHKLFNHCVDNERNRSMKFTNKSQIKPELIAEYVRESCIINEKGIKLPKAPKIVIIPDDVQFELDKNIHLKEIFENMAYSHRKEYMEWIESAKQAETRSRRIGQFLGKIGNKEGLHHKYKK